MGDGIRHRPGSGTGRWLVRYRDMENIDLDAARKAVCAWLDEHTDGGLGQMADELKHRYPDYPEEMAIVLRGMMAAELRRRTQISGRRGLLGVKSRGSR